MSDDPFIVAAEKTVITSKEMKELEQRLDTFDNICEKENTASQPDQNFFNRIYSI